MMRDALTVGAVVVAAVVLADLVSGLDLRRRGHGALYVPLPSEARAATTQVTASVVRRSAAPPATAAVPVLAAPVAASVGRSAPPATAAGPARTHAWRAGTCETPAAPCAAAGLPVALRGTCVVAATDEAVGPELCAGLPDPCAERTTPCVLPTCPTDAAPPCARDAEARAVPGVCPPGAACAVSNCEAPWSADRCSYAACEGTSRAVITGRPCRIVSGAPGGAFLRVRAADGRISVRGGGAARDHTDAFEVTPSGGGYVIAPSAPRAPRGPTTRSGRFLSVSGDAVVLSATPSVWHWRCGYLLTGGLALAYVPNAPDRYPDGYALATEAEFNHASSVYKTWSTEIRSRAP